jgi:hypothetical protein
MIRVNPINILLFVQILQRKQFEEDFFLLPIIFHNWHGWLMRMDGRFWYNQRWFDYSGTTIADMKGGLEENSPSRPFTTSGNQDKRLLPVRWVEDSFFVRLSLSLVFS